MKKKPIVAVLMSVRNEENFIDFNIAYHLDLNFDYIFIANHCSTDCTEIILKKYKDNPRIIVVNEADPVFDHARIINNLLKIAKENYVIDWFIFLDADEFLSINNESIHDFVGRLESKSIPYATIGWANALFDYTHSDYTCSPVNRIDTLKYYYPWPEKKWQEYGHFRKAIVKNHDNMEVVVGGHYVKTENNRSFFGDFDWNPHFVPCKEARLLHFEFRDTADILYKKWAKLAEYEDDSTSSKDAPWMERIQTIKKYIEEFKDNIGGINKKWFFEHSTFWGTPIPENKIIFDNTLAIWHGKFFRRKIEKGEIKKLCLVRVGNLGDVVMTGPVASFLKKYVHEITLATDVKNYNLINKTYDNIVSYKDAFGNNGFDAVIRLTYEFSTNDRSYINGFMESVGFYDVKIEDVPLLKEDFKKIVTQNYILVAPHTSQWQAEKRNWGYQKFTDLAKLMESDIKIKTIMLEDSYSFNDMISLIRNCSFFVGNDSGPAIIAQSFNKKSFVIFGATNPKYLHLSPLATVIYDKYKHSLCLHKNRQDEIDCCEPFCMDKFKVNDVFNIIKQNYEQK